MRFFLILAVLCLWTQPLFSQNQRTIARFYSDYLKGVYYIEKGEYLLGVKELEKAKSKNPQSIHIRLKIATALIRLEKVEEAEKVLKEAKEIAPDNLDVSLALIFVYSYAQRNDKLEKEYEEFLKNAHQAKPKDIGISEYLAQFYFYKKKPQEAIQIYERILESNPEYVEAFFWLGYLYNENGRQAEAIDVWEKGLEKDSSCASILNSLGYTYASEGVKLDQAEEMVKKALEKEPENGAYLDSLGWIYFKKGNLEKAEECLNKAVSFIKDPDVYEHLGDLYIQMGDIEKGVKYYKEGQAYFPGNKSLELKSKEYEQEDKILKK
ncbi:MAG: tetratricopeptide repeat protein [Candidatus Omnitrophota bacterium]